MMKEYDIYRLHKAFRALIIYNAFDGPDDMLYHCTHHKANPAICLECLDYFTEITDEEPEVCKACSAKAVVSVFTILDKIDKLNKGVDMR